VYFLARNRFDLYTLTKKIVLNPPKRVFWGSKRHLLAGLLATKTAKQSKCKPTAKQMWHWVAGICCKFGRRNISTATNNDRTERGLIFGFGSTAPFATRLPLPTTLGQG